MATATQDPDTMSPEDEEAARALNAAPDPPEDGPTEEEARAQGKTLEQLAAEAEAEAEVEKPLPPSQLAIPGTREKIIASFGGKQPTDSELRIMGGKRPIDGSFEKGETITVLSTGTIRAVEGSDTDDEWGTVSKVTRIHKMRQIHVRVATPEALMRALIGLGLQRAELTVLYDELAG